jgi:hypothetical protein
MMTPEPKPDGCLVLIGAIMFALLALGVLAYAIEHGWSSTP